MRRFTLVFVTLISTWAGAVDSFQNPHLSRRGESVAMPIATGAGLIDRKPRIKANVEGWGLTSSEPHRYELRCDAIYSNCVTQILRSKGAAAASQMGSVTHSESAEAWRGRRIEFRVNIKAGNVAGWAGAWVRIDDEHGRALAFDDMRDRAVTGTTGFEGYSVVLDVPAQAQRISMAAMLNGEGAVLIRKLSFGAVDQEASAIVTDLLARGLATR